MAPLGREAEVTRVLRTRSRSFTVSGSVALYPSPNYTGTPSYTPGTITRSSSCSDYRGRPITDSPFTSYQRSGAVIWNGKARNGVSSRIFLKFPQSGGGTGEPDALAYNTLPPPNGWYLTAIARSNPSRPVVTPPELLQDFVEIPRQLRDVWKALRHPKSIVTPKGLANNYLGIKFGWLPLLEDVENLLNLQALVTKRSQELAQLYSGRGLRRRIKFGEDTKSFSTYNDIAMSGVNSFVRLRHDQLITKKSWATIRWKPTEIPPYHPQDARSINQIRRIVLGLTPEGMAKGLWNVIPWTWLIGWFTNVGSYLLVKSNTVPAIYSNCCFMSMMVSTIVPVNPTAINCIIDEMKPSGGLLRIDRTRIVADYVLPGVNIPFLGVSQLSVLAALGTQRMRSVP